MDKKTLRYRALTFIAMSAMVYLFFAQARVALRSTGLEFKSASDIAFAYSNVAFSGKVYWDEGVTPVGIGTGVALYVNGAATSTTTTIAGGAYSFTGLTISAHDVVSIFIDGEAEDGMLVGKFNDSVLQNAVTGMDIYKDRLLLRTGSTDLQITTTNLNTADGTASDADVTAVYTLNGDDLHLGNNKELLIINTTTHVASGSLYIHDLDVRGRLTMGTGNITASGSVAVTGTGSMTLTGDMTLTSVDSGEILNVKSTTLGNLYIDNGLEAYFRFDEGVGLNASGSTFNTGTGGTLTNGAAWVTTNTGTTTFYNAHALEFDGTDDFVDFGDAYDISNTIKKTFTGWFRRKSSTTEDVIFSKKSASGSSNAGYQLYIDDESDSLLFEVADGTNTYTITSTSTVTDVNWHQFGVTWNPFDSDESNIFLDGAIDVASKAGSMSVSSATYTTAQNFIIGADDNGTGPFIGTIDDFRIYNRIMSGSELATLASGAKASGSGAYTLGSNLDINGDLGIYGSVLDMSESYAINVTGDASIYGELRTNSGTVTLDGVSAQTIRGSTAFNQLAATTTVAKTITFESNTQQTVSGALTLQGTLGQYIALRASNTGSRALLIVESSGATLLEYLNVKDNNAFSGATLACTAGCVNSGNNTNWLFLGECQDGIVNTGEQCDDGNSNNTDSCPNDCQFAVCGDSVIEGEEQCEPPNSLSCLSNCLLRSAGGGGGGNLSSASANASYHKREEPPDGCGNGVVDYDKDEECDEGTRFNGLGTCSHSCKTLFCGDGVVSPQLKEDCEPKVLGTANGVTTYEVNTCGEKCSVPVISNQGTQSGGCRRQFLAPCGSEGGGAASSPSQSTSPVCGNGTVESGEECDAGGVCNGGTFDGSFWTDKTSADTCKSGGGTSKAESGDGCSNTCKTEFCGDGNVQSRGADNRDGTADDEQCDNGSICSNDPSKTCRLDTECGTGNTCDYHGAKSTSCSNSCKGITSNLIPSTSTPNPKPASTVKDPIVEGKKDQEPVKPSAPNVEPITSNTQCGNGIIEGNERCDSGSRNSDIYSDSCRTNCQLPRCGDGVQDSGEECDGGMQCTSLCKSTVKRIVCGNRIVEAGEQCDDGNLNPDDGCGRYCQVTDIPEIPVVQKVECEEGSELINGTCQKTINTLVASVNTLVLDADIVVVNPTEYADALKFISTNNACSTLTIKGKSHKAAAIREAAVRQRIPIVKNIALAQEIYNNHNAGDTISGEICTSINALKTKAVGTVKSQKPEDEVLLPSAPMPPIQNPIQQPLPQAPTQYGYGYYPYAQVTPSIVNRAPTGETGPGMVGVVITGVAGGLGWMRRKRKKV
jgi:cysteine-rich repeat protein